MVKYKLTDLTYPCPYINGFCVGDWRQLSIDACGTIFFKFYNSLNSLFILYILYLVDNSFFDLDLKRLYFIVNLDLY